MLKILAHIKPPLTFAPTQLCRAVGPSVRPYAALTGQTPFTVLVPHVRGSQVFGIFRGSPAFVGRRHPSVL